MTPSLDQARKFLARVVYWPDEGDEPTFLNIHSTFQKAGYDKPGWGGRACRSLDEAVKSIEFLSKLPDTRDVYFCTSTQRAATEKTGKNDYKYYMPIRNQGNAVKLKALFLDVDCKGGENGYPHLSAAVEAVGKFIKDAGLPKPTALVRSGGGLHVYFTLMRALTPDEWKPLAFALAEATKRHGLKADTQCTVDSARILRIPGTLNRKTTPPREVKLQHVADFDYDNQRIEQALEPYKVAIPASAPQSFLENPELFKPRKPVTYANGGANDLAAGVEQTQAAPINLDSVLPHCGFLNEAVTSGGKNYSQPLWFLTTSIASFCEDGRKQAHRMASGHPGYTKESTDELYDRVEREKTSKNFGWPSCAKVSACGSKHCQGCPLLAQGKSPLNFAQRVSTQTLTPQPPVSTNTLPSQVTTPAPVPMPLPLNYVQQTDGKVLRTFQAPDGTTETFAVCDYPMSDPWLQRDPEWMLHFTSALETGTPKQIHISTRDATEQKLRPALQEQGLMLHDHQTKQMRSFIVSWIQTLQKTKNAVTSAAPFGWQMAGGKIDGFVFAGKCFTPNGEKPAGFTDPMLANHYAPAGSAQPWIAAAKMITDQKRPALDAIVAAAFAAPLVRFTGHSGLLMSAYSSESGIGKSTAMKVGQAVWGDPVRAMQGLSDTPLSVTHKIGQLKVLPLYWDELKSQYDTEKFVNLVFQLSSGKEKSRLKQDASMREGGTWQTLLVSASNDSVLDYVVSNNKMSTAGLYRVFEYTVTPGTIGQIATSDAQRLLSQLHDNYGYIGLDYAKWLGTNFVQIDQDVAAILKDIEKTVNAASDERFWVGLVACVLLGAQYANGLGFTNIDEAALRVFMLGVFNQMRGERAQQPVDMGSALNVSHVLAQYLTAMRKRNTLFTDRIHKGRGKPAKNSVKIDPRTDTNALDEVLVHIGIDDKILRLKAQPFSAWLGINGYSPVIFRRALLEKYDVKGESGRLGGGTNYAVGYNEQLLEIPLAGTELAKQFDVD
jgi:Domain of unknown function (DUF927)